MLDKPIQFIELTHRSSEFDAAYDVFSHDIPPEFLETREFLRNRLRVRDEGPKTGQEKILAQDGYTLHLIAARENDKVVGATYGHLISKIGVENRGIGFVTYISVLPAYRRRGIGTRLIEELKENINQDALRITGQPIIGMVLEIEQEGKEEIKGCVRRLQGWPLCTHRRRFVESRFPFTLRGRNCYNESVVEDVMPVF